LKALLNKGVFQEESGVSFALGAGPLLPYTNKEENRFGLEAIGIVRAKLGVLTYHVNLDGGLD